MKYEDWLNTLYAEEQSTQPTSFIKGIQELCTSLESFPSFWILWPYMMINPNRRDMLLWGYNVMSTYVKRVYFPSFHKYKYKILQNYHKNMYFHIYRYKHNVILTISMDWSMEAVCIKAQVHVQVYIQYY